jgi:hypothetical protein
MDRLEQCAASRPDWKRSQADSVDGFLLFLEKVRFYLDARNRDQRDSRGRYRVHCPPALQLPCIPTSSSFRSFLPALCSECWYRFASDCSSKGSSARCDYGASEQQRNIRRASKDC